ncbi:hypothetical protein [Amycolatopsis vancoresmycina]|uniref:Uncharacterized protein n=1 Tax=Amycolatopsis vancoresmycina DSM 44592 TaxID=1292037 RepID=R1G0Q4_9PSEU|nr:hypothetical protein [Amycolatopsis vancoresmycina]EOD65087.1 hypothetical protein H480_28316 [Amycolatopsis vancoresmycina DSM 44592]
MEEPIIVLLPGERLLWSGRSRRVVPTGREWFRMALGSLLVAGPVAAGLSDPAGGFPVVAAVFAAFGLAIAWGPVLWRLRTTRRAVYTVTDQRVLVADRVSGRTREEYLSDLEPPILDPGQDGTGTLTLRRLDASVNVFGVPVPVRNGSVPIELFTVPDAARLCRLIEEEQDWH